MTRVIPSICLLLSLLAAEAPAETSDIKLKAVPNLSEVRPFSDPVRIILNVLDSKGGAVSGEWLKIRLYAPTRHMLFSTDFPRVEGTLLIDMTLPASQGRVEWDYVFPIRGVYRLEAESVGEKGIEIKKVFELQIKEDRRKFIFLGGFIAALFLLGFAAGRLFTAAR